MTLHDLVGSAEPVLIPLSLPVELRRERQRTVEERPTGRVTTTVRSLSVVSELEIPGGRSFCVDGCTGKWVDYRWQYRSQARPRP